MVSAKHAFWQALVVAIALFGIGMMFGFFVENWRSDAVYEELLASEVHVFDEQVRQRITSDVAISCPLAQQSLFAFADRIYGEAQKLERYDASSKFSTILQVLHRRYDVLRTSLWIEGIALEKRCPERFHRIVYLYEYNPQDVEMRARQAFFSRLLVDLKEKNGEQILLIPIATNMNITSLEVMTRHYNITASPVIVIDERAQTSEVITFEELEKIVFSRVRY